MALGLMDFFRRKGLKVQPYKVGPDFIDPSLHSFLTGRISRNLDSFLLKPEIIQTLFSKSSGDAEISVIEGVAGLFDGYSGCDSRGSTSDIAKILDCPVLLVCDAKNSARSLAAVVKGFLKFEKRIKIIGVFLNRLANQKHLEWCREAIEKKCRVPVLGYLFTSQNLVMTERHMGLIPSAEKKLDSRWLRELRCQMDTQVNWRKILRKCYSELVSGSLEMPNQVRHDITRAEPTYKERVRIGIARDRAFSFYYQDNLDLLENLGAELVSFSPIEDPHLPKDVSGIYFGGGFPELYAEFLQANKSMRKEIFSAVQSGMPVYAECGGLMYMGRTLTDYQKRKFRMVGVLPFRTCMTDKISMAYVRCKTKKENLLAKKGEQFPGQLFHFSKLLSEKRLDSSYLLSNGAEHFADGFLYKNLLASYVHIHFWSKLSLAKNFINRCRRAKNGKN